MWIQAGGSLLSGLAAGNSAKKQQKQQFKYDWKLQEGAGRIARTNTKFEYELQNYYKQLERKEKMRGLAEFRKFSTVSQFAPNYQNTTPETPMPTMTSPNSGEYAVVKK
jgi:hypothetical protein